VELDVDNCRDASMRSIASTRTPSLGCATCAAARDRRRRSLERFRRIGNDVANFASRNEMLDR
jgi:hypothetical protein